MPDGTGIKTRGGIYDATFLFFCLIFLSGGVTRMGRNILLGSVKRSARSSTRPDSQTTHELLIDELIFLHDGFSK